MEGDGGPGRSPRAKGLALAALSLVCLVVAAVATPEGPPFDTDPSGVVTPRVPTVVGLVLLVFGVVAAMGVAYLVLVTAGVPDDYRARRRRLWATLAALMAVAAIVAIAASASRPLGEDDRGLNEPVQEQRDERAVPPDPSSRSTDALGAAVALLLGLGFLGVAAAAIYRRRAWEGVAPDEEEEDAFVAEVDAGIDDLRSIRDPRAAVIACYARMERFLRSEGLSRRPSDTPLEFIARALRRRDVGGRSPLALTRLFERARFSHHRVDEQMRAEALAALEDVRARLKERR